MKLQYAIFDLDGTILDSVPDLTDAVNYALHRHGFASKTEQEIRAAVGHGIVNLLEQTSGCRDTATIQALHTDFNHHYNQYFCHRSTVYDGMIPLLTTLKQAGIGLGVYSNKPTRFVKLIVEQLFEDQLFDIVLGQQEGYPTKPDATQLLEELNQRGISADHCCYIGDSDVDVKTAQNANLPMIAVLWGYRSREELLQAGATQLISDAKSLENALLTH